MKEIIDAIIALEWESFQAVHGANGRASCQDDYVTFERMRRSQFLAWPEDLCKMYLEHLKECKAVGRNLISEKYARMMEFTAPLEYQKIKDLLPKVPAEMLAMSDRTTAFHVAWLKEFSDKYPKLAARSRPVSGKNIFTGDTSFTTYLQCELLTYSLDVLYEYGAYVLTLYQQGRNLHAEIIANMVKLAGYASLEDAERRL